MQVTLTTNPNCAVACIANAAKGHINGVEGQGQLQLTRYLSFSGAATYLNAKYTSVDPTVGALIPGDNFPNVPKFRMSVGGAHVLPFVPENVGSIRFGANFVHQTKVSELL